MEMFKIVTPNDIEINAYVIHSNGHVKICYAQNRLFTVYETNEVIDGERINEFHFGEVIIDYCVIPELDSYEKEEIIDNSRE